MKKFDSEQILRMGRVSHIHFVGIGGVGMCGIAEVLNNSGYKVTGSDMNEGGSVSHLRSLGVAIEIGHEGQNIGSADVVVRSTAIADNNPEIIAARENFIPVIPRAMMLAELMRFSYGIAVAGTHGKTTTTSLLSCILAELDPSFVIGGKLNSSSSNAKLGSSPYFVAEADESDASFLFLKPMMAIVTNIDADHLQTYGDDFGKLRETFVEFLHHLPFYGLAVVCIDDVEVQRILPEIQRPTVTYGFDEGAKYRAYDCKQNGLISEFRVARPEGYSDLYIRSNCPGKHNIQNALAAIAVATELGVDDAAIKESLLNFPGVGRRFQLLGERTFAKGDAIIVDDYGHHPREIRSTIEAFRAVWPNKRLIHVFQPHRYTRTQSLFSEFTNVLSLSDELLLLDIYPAGEEKIPGVSSASLANDIKEKFPNVHLVNESNIEEFLNKSVNDGDAILVQGAGSIGQLALRLANSEETEAHDIKA